MAHKKYYTVVYADGTAKILDTAQAYEKAIKEKRTKHTKSYPVLAAAENFVKRYKAKLVYEPEPEQSIEEKADELISDTPEDESVKETNNSFDDNEEENASINNEAKEEVCINTCPEITTEKKDTAVVFEEENASINNEEKEKVRINTHPEITTEKKDTAVVFNMIDEETIDKMSEPEETKKRPKPVQIPKVKQTEPEIKPTEKSEPEKSFTNVATPGNLEAVLGIHESMPNSSAQRSTFIRYSPLGAYTPEDNSSNLFLPTSTYIDEKMPADYAYVDGSRTRLGCGFGIMFHTQGQDLFLSSKCESAISSEDAEIEAATRAIELALALKLKSLTIYYDYTGIVSFQHFEDGRTPSAQRYTYALMKAYSAGLLIDFSKVKGHSGERRNQVVDKLASSAANRVS